MRGAGLCIGEEGAGRVGGRDGFRGARFLGPREGGGITPEEIPNIRDTTTHRADAIYASTRHRRDALHVVTGAAVGGAWGIMGGPELNLTIFGGGRGAAAVGEAASNLYQILRIRDAESAWGGAAPGASSEHHQ